MEAFGWIPYCPALEHGLRDATLPRGEQRVCKRSGCLRGEPATGELARRSWAEGTPKRAEGGALSLQLPNLIVFIILIIIWIVTRSGQATQHGLRIISQRIEVPTVIFGPGLADYAFTAFSIAAMVAMTASNAGASPISISVIAR